MINEQSWNAINKLKVSLLIQIYQIHKDQFKKYIVYKSCCFHCVTFCWSVRGAMLRTGPAAARRLILFILLVCIVEGHRDTKSKRALASLRDDLADQMSSKRSYRSPVDDLKNVQIDDRTVLYCNSKTSTVRYVQCNRCQSYWSPKDDQSLLLLSLSLV